MTVMNQEAPRTEVAIIGAGIVGLFNALQYAKRGFQVTLIDDVVNQKRSYKVGESLLVFSNAFLRTIGGLDEFLVRESVPKRGVWFTYGAEGQTDFDGTTEWALERTLPESFKANFPNQFLYRAGIEDAQIVRPEVEDLMADMVRAFPNATFLDTAKVKDVRISEDGQPHELLWESRSTGTSGTVAADWVIDCSGRVRYLAKRLNHRMEDLELQDGFQTTAVWAQFSGIRKEMFADAWGYRFPDGGSTQRERCTVHLWGEGYWIWVINLSKGRISIGVTFNQKIAPPGTTFEEQFWNVLQRYPMFDGVLLKENVLEFRVYKNVQYMSDTFVSPLRYGIAGDAASIIDAYYSQGMSHSFLTSWHIANIVEEDLREKRLNTEYIDRVNESLREDWRMIRNMLKGKFTPAIADSRFFLLSHMLDMVMFFSIAAPKIQITRWLVETECSTAKEQPIHRKIRKYLARRLFYSQIFRPVPPQVTRRAFGFLQRVITRRAQWRLEHGVKVPRIKCIVRFSAGIIPFWRTFWKPGNTCVDLSPDEIKATPPKFLQITGTERFPLALKLANVFTILAFLCYFVYDWAATSWHKLAHAFRVDDTAVAEGALTASKEE
jgi:2-polyprenyl-6-methoxyphenol hydroxylase-like FAD-dependent oxidoreductase